MQMVDKDRAKRMIDSLEGLSVGDAFGEQFFVHRRVVAELRLKGPNAFGIVNLREAGEPITPPPWRWTDDTAMALSIVSTLEKFGDINGDFLARCFADQYSAEPRRGYGPAMHSLLPQLRNTRTRHRAVHQLFGGQGSFGNGAAMRVAPLGAFFADDLKAVAEQARISAEITHSHSEGIAGAQAVALAAAIAWRCRGTLPPPAHEFLDTILPMIPVSLVANGVRIARDLASTGATLTTVINRVGNGSEVTAQDTVPFALWSAALHLSNYEEALWQTVSALGNMDTNCAIVGGIVAVYVGVDNIPVDWRKNREPLPHWVTQRFKSR